MAAEGSERIAIFAGSFDPPTCGHIDIVQRGAKLFDQLVVAVMDNHEKRCWFSADERVDLLQRSLNGLPNVRVVADSGLLVDAARRFGAGVILRGIRSADDLAFELQLAVANRKLSGIETIFLPASPETGHLSSSIVNGYAMHGADLRGMAPEAIIEDVKRVHLKSRNQK